jgi:hypothetical protein
MANLPVLACENDMHLSMSSLDDGGTIVTLYKAPFFSNNSCSKTDRNPILWDFTHDYRILYHNTVSLPNETNGSGACWGQVKNDVAPSELPHTPIYCGSSIEKINIQGFNSSDEPGFDYTTA